MIPHPSTKWDVYRDAEGNPVTITPAQCSAIKHAFRVWQEVLEAEGTYPDLLQRIKDFMPVYYGLVVEKSCLMGRMLYQGKPPFDDAPPTYLSAPIYPEWERENEEADGGR